MHGIWKSRINEATTRSKLEGVDVAHRVQKSRKAVKVEMDSLRDTINDLRMRPMH